MGLAIPLRVRLEEVNDWCQAQEHKDLNDIDKCISIGGVSICLECITEAAGGSILTFYTQDEVNDACSLQHDCDRDCCQ